MNLDRPATEDAPSTYVPFPGGRRLRLAVFISGGGRSLKNLLDRSAAGKLQADVAIVLSSSPEAGGLAYAREANVPSQSFVRKDFASTEDYSAALFGAAREAGADLIVMAGFLKHVLVPPDYRLKAINIHPSLVPAFSGHGFYGHRVHAAAIEYGVKVSGCTVHFVDDCFDHGPILSQRTVPVLPDDTPDMLAARVFEQELIALPEAIDALARGEVTIEGRVVRVAEGRVS